MPKTCIVRAIIPSIDATVDPSSNTFCFYGSGASDFSGVTPLLTAVENFYNTTSGGASEPIGYYLSDVLNRGTGACALEVYDITSHLDGSPHGAPVAMTSWTLHAGAGSTSIPEGVAATLSIRADYGTDVEFGPGTRPRARDRNRIYLGPLQLPAFAEDSTTHRCTLKSTFVADVLAKAVYLSASIDLGGDNWVWQVWSRKNAATKVPIQAWMDNRPDYQRRRSDPNPASRTYVDLASV